MLATYRDPQLLSISGEETLVRGAAEVAGQARMYRAAGLRARFAVVNGGPGIISVIDGRLTAVLAFTIADGLIVEIDILADPQRVATLDFAR